MTPDQAQTPDVLVEILASSRARVAAAIRPSGRFGAALRAGRELGHVSVIAEHKRASPSAGTIRADQSLEAVIGAYASAGAAALSILTEPHRFAGSLADLSAARAATELPLLRKDFIVDPYQVYEASVAGADAILLIVAAFPGDTESLRALQRLAEQLGLEVLMEVHDAHELFVALELEAPIIGINNRNLATLKVDLATTHALRREIPAGRTVVAESGLRSPDQIRALAEIGVDAVLVGEALMRAPDIAAATRAITGATPAPVIGATPAL